MDYCLLEDAFKTESIGCKDNVGTQSARKHERKKMKKNRDYFKSIDTSFDPTATESNSPAAKDYSEAFQNIDVKVPSIPKKSEEQKLPSYFLGYDEDSNIEDFTSDFSKSDEKGFEKASGANLPTPSINDSWKPLTLANNTTSFFDELPTPGGTYPIWKALKAQPREIKDELDNDKPKKDSSTNTVLQRKIDELIRRLDELEKKNKPTNQEEILAFVGTGIFVIFGLSLLKC